MKFSQKITLFAAAVLIMGTVFSSTMIFHFTRRLLMEHIKKEQQAIARSAMTQVDQILHDASEDIQLFSENVLGGEPLGAGAAMEDRMIFWAGHWDNLLVVDKDGVVVDSTREKMVGETIRKYPASNVAFEKSISARVYYSDLVRSDINDRPTVIFASPIIHQADGKIAGVLIGHFSWPVVMQVLNQIDPFDHAHVFNKDGVIIATTFSERASILKERAYDYDPIKKTLVEMKGQSGVFRCVHADQEEGELFVTTVLEQGFLSHRGNGWGLLLEAPLSVVLGPVNRMRKMITFYAGIGILAIVIAFYFLSRRFINPLETLTAAVAAIGSGNFDVRAEVRNKDEIGLLADSFNQMAQRLKQTTTSIEKLEMEIGQRKEVEKRLVEARAVAEAALRARSQFIANVSHELHTPLNSVIGFSSVMLDNYATTLDAKQKEYLSYIKTGGEHLLTLIDSIIDISKMDAKEGEVSYSSFLMKDSLSHVLDLLRSKITDGQIEVSCEIDDDLGQVIKADERKLSQILYALIANAVKFSSPGGLVILNARKVLTADEKEMVEVSVIDHGIGIAEENIKKIFAPFEQLDMSVCKTYPGLGLGLVLAKKLTELHGGRIWAESQGLGKGSTLKFTFPFERG